MEANSLQAHELHKKFEDLNDEISHALGRQEDAINSTRSLTGSGAPLTSRKEVMRLTTRAIDWREDVSALAKHIDLQLQHSRALRSKEADVLARSDGGDKKPAVEDDDGAKLRCLRSDLRLLYEFRMALTQSQGKLEATNDKAFTALLETLDADGRQQKELVEKSIKAEKSGRKDAQAAMVVQLFEARRELMGKISEDVLKDRRPMELDVEIIGAPSPTRPGGGSDDKDVLASWDAQLYLRLVQTLLDQEKELQERYRLSSSPQLQQQQQQSDQQPDEQPNEAGDAALRRKTSATDVTPAAKPTPVTGQPTASLDELNFALQKLRRDHVELKQSQGKVMMANAQLEDDLAHLQRKYDDDKRAHVNEKKWYVPKIQKLEETVVATAKAFEALKLNVELLTNMYKSLRQTLAAHEAEESELKRERDQLAALLAGEIKKVALLAKENARKDKLVAIAMAARHEMAAVARDCEASMKTLAADKLAVAQHASEQAQECSVLKLQLDGAYTRLGATDDALRLAKQTIERLTSELDVCLEAARVKEAEMKGVFDRELLALQQKYDKTKRELMDAMSQNLSLDGRLRKLQDKLAKLASPQQPATATKEGERGM